MISQIADYDLLEEIGQGNFGVFYLARPPARLRVDDEFVAVKMFGSGTRVNAVTFRRAVAELKAFGAVRSPFLVRLFDAGQERGVFYYAMEFCPLGSMASPTGTITAAAKMRAVEHAARAAHDLHEAGIVHRDIKPANILLHADGGRLSDLGLAQVLAPGLTVTSFGGARSLQYLDPSILHGARPSRASDIWGLGVSLHVALTGIGVYPRLNEDDVLVAMRTIASSAPKFNAQLSPEERSLISACLAPAVADRPRTALEVAEQLQRLASRDVSTRS